MKSLVSVRALIGAALVAAFTTPTFADFPDEYKHLLHPIDTEPVDATSGEAGGPRGLVPLLVKCDGADGAFTTIQAAIDAAVDGEVIFVYPNDCTEDGRWHENIDFLGKAISVQNSNTNDPSLIDTTIIDGGATDSVVKFVNGEDWRSHLIGLTIMNGRPEPGQYGGGVRCIDALPTIRQCVFRDNEALRGSGIYVNSIGPIFIDSCQFIHNTTTGEANTGSAAYFRSGSRPVLFNCSFEQHVGYAIRTIDNVPTYWACSEIGACGLVQSCDFVGNVAPSESGSTISLVRGSGTTISDCNFLDNEGICVAGPNIDILNSRFEGNHDASSLILIDGFAPQIFDSVEFVSNYNIGTVVDRFLGVNVQFEMSDCHFIDNTASQIMSYQGLGEIRNSSFLDNTCSSDVVELRPPGPWLVDRCNFERNSSSLGEILSYSPANDESVVRESSFVSNTNLGTSAFSGCVSGPYLVQDCLIVGNRVNSSSIPVRCDTLYGSTIVGNRSGLNTSGAFTEKTYDCIISDNRSFNQFGARPQLSSDVTRYSIVQGGANGIGVLDLDPKFVDPGHWDDMGTPEDLEDDVFIPGNYHLRADSPCIDSGNPMFVPEADAADLDGEARLQSCRVDIGADEFTQEGSPLPGDMNGDNVLDLDDLPAFIAKTLEPYGLGVCAADVNADGVVNGNDISDFVALLLGN